MSRAIRSSTGSATIIADYSKKDGYITTRLDSKISSGLARPDYFDWPARLTQAMAGDPRPEAVVFMVGANDDTDLRVDARHATRAARPNGRRSTASGRER